MPRPKKALQTSSTADHRVLDPEPPAKLWEELDALCVEAGMRGPVEQPLGTFTAAQYARERGLHPSSTSLRMHKLLRAGKIEYMGRGTNNEKFYRIVKK